MRNVLGPKTRKCSRKHKKKDCDMLQENCYYYYFFFFEERRRGSSSRHSYIGGWESTQVGRSCQVHDGTRGRDVILPETHLTALNSHKLMNKVGRATSEAARHVRQDVWKGFFSDFLLLLKNNLLVSLSVWRVRVKRMGLSVLFILFVCVVHIICLYVSPDVLFFHWTWFWCVFPT